MVSITPFFHDPTHPSAVANLQIFISKDGIVDYGEDNHTNEQGQELTDESATLQASGLSTSRSPPVPTVATLPPRPASVRKYPSRETWCPEKMANDLEHEHRFENSGLHGFFFYEQSTGVRRPSAARPPAPAACALCVMSTAAS